MRGKLKWFSKEKNFGFIEGENNSDYFLHGSQVPDGMSLEDGVELTFDVTDTDKGKQAINIQYAD